MLLLFRPPAMEGHHKQPLLPESNGFYVFNRLSQCLFVYQVFPLEGFFFVDIFTRHWSLCSLVGKVFFWTFIDLNADAFKSMNVRLVLSSRICMPIAHYLLLITHFFYASPATPGMTVGI